MIFTLFLFIPQSGIHNVVRKRQTPSAPKVAVSVAGKTKARAKLFAPRPERMHDRPACYFWCSADTRTLLFCVSELIFIDFQSMAEIFDASSTSLSHF